MTARPQHTPEPWTYEPGVDTAVGFDLSPGIRGADGFYPASITIDCPDTIFEANGQRIVACVNACAGLNPEAIPALVAEVRRIAEWNPDFHEHLMLGDLRAALAAVEVRP